MNNATALLTLLSVGTSYRCLVSVEVGSVGICNRRLRCLLRLALWKEVSTLEDLLRRLGVTSALAFLQRERYWVVCRSGALGGGCWGRPTSAANSNWIAN